MSALPLLSLPPLLISDQQLGLQVTLSLQPLSIHLFGGIFAQRGGGIYWDGVTALDTQGRVPPSFWTLGLTPSASGKLVGSQLSLGITLR